MKDYPVRMTIGQAVFVTLCLLVIGFITFYLGARFGPEVFWNIQVDRLAQESLLPSETSEEELLKLLNEESLPKVTFHEELQKNSASIGPLDNSQNDPIPLLVPQAKTKIQPDQEAEVVEEEKNEDKQAAPAEKTVKTAQEVKTSKPVEIKTEPKVIKKEAALKKEVAPNKAVAPKKSAVVPKKVTPPQKTVVPQKVLPREVKTPPTPQKSPPPPQNDPIQKVIEHQEVIW